MVRGRARCWRPRSTKWRERWPARAAVYKLDIDQSPDIASRYGVMSVPTLMVFEGGQVKKQAVGAQPKQNILALLA